MNKKVFHKLSYGLYIVSSKKEDKFNGQIANTVFQVSSRPPTIAVSLNKENFTNEYVKESSVFTVSVLSTETPMKFIGLFGFKSGRDIDKFINLKYKIGVTGAPVVLENTVAYLECRVIKSMDISTHTLFVGEVIDADIVEEVEPMTYDFYHKVKKGLSPKTAPTYIGEEKNITEQKEDKMKKYKCTICGYIYDPQKGDPDSGIKPGTSFEDIPDDWVCPVCGVGKDSFEVIE